MTHFPWVWKMASTLIGDFFNGVSHVHWFYKHVIGHHTYTNVPGVDPDNSVNDGGFRRLHSIQRWIPRYEGQEIWAPLMYCLWTTVKRPEEVKEMYVKKKIMSIRLNEMTVLDHAIFWGGKPGASKNNWRILFLPSLASDCWLPTHEKADFRTVLAGWTASGLVPDSGIFNQYMRKPGAGTNCGALKPSRYLVRDTVTITMADPFRSMQ
ncbi:hypothetical protein HDU93_003910, partial [Gonapodya sp. JEL0774]